MKFLFKISLLILLTVTLHAFAAETAAGEHTYKYKEEKNSVYFLSPDQAYANALRNCCRRLYRISREFMEPAADKISYGTPAGNLPAGYSAYGTGEALRNDFSCVFLPKAPARCAGYYIYCLRKIVI